MRLFVLPVIFLCINLLAWEAWDGGDPVGKIIAEANPAKIEEWKKLANSGDPYAQSCLGLCYVRGDLGIEKDEVKAVFWHRKAAEQGSTYSQCALGDAYIEGKGVSKNATEGAKWIRKAAENGDSIAQYILGNLYAEGRGVLKDEVEAFKWYRISAEQGLDFAFYSVANCYHNGAGVTENKVEAYAWFNLTGLAFDLPILKKSGIEKNMTAAERIEGQKRSKEILNKIEEKIRASSTKK